MKLKIQSPPIEEKEFHDYNNQQRNSSYFCFRFENPLKLVEPTRNFYDNYITLTKLQKAQYKWLKIYEKQNIKKYPYLSSDLKRYKNMLPTKIWNKCQKTYEECKRKNNSLIEVGDKKEKNKFNLNLTKNLSMINIRDERITRYKFENRGLNKFIKKIENNKVNNIHNNNINYIY